MHTDLFFYFLNRMHTDHVCHHPESLPLLPRLVDLYEFVSYNVTVLLSSLPARTLKDDMAISVVAPASQRWYRAPFIMQWHSHLSFVLQCVGTPSP